MFPNDTVGIVAYSHTLDVVMVDDAPELLLGVVTYVDTFTPFEEPRLKVTVNVVLRKETQCFISF